MQRFSQRERTASTAVALSIAVRHCYGGLPSRSKRAFDNPLAAKDPALRSVMIPDSFHTNMRNETPKGAKELRERAMKAMARRQAEEVLWQGTVIKDANNPLLDALRKARNNPAFRNSRRMVVAGGKMFLQELAGFKIYPETLLLPSGAEVPAWAEDGKCEIIPVTKEAAQSVDPGGDGYIGNFKMPEPPGFEQLMSNKQRLDRVLVLDNVSDPGNLGTLLRTASAFTYDAVLLTNHCADLYHHSTVRAARGVHFMENMKIYVLREEDGDDTYAMINHIIQRNDLQTVAYTPLPFEASANRMAPSQHLEPPGRLLPRTLFGTKPKALPTNGGTTTDGDSPKNEGRAAHIMSNSWPHQTAVPAPSLSSSSPSNTPRSVSGGAPTVSSAVGGAVASSSTLPQNAATAKKLFSFMVESFVSSAKPTSVGQQTPRGDSGHFKEKGLMLFAGPDVRQNMVRKLEQRVSKPTTVLQLDEPEGGLGLSEDEGQQQQQSATTALSSGATTSSNSDLMTSLPSIMYALRPNGHWDYLLPNERHDPNVTYVSRGTVQIGSEHTAIYPPPLDEVQQTNLADEHNHWRRNKRLLSYKRTDEGYWLESENTMADIRGKMELNERSSPFAKFTGDSSEGGLKKKLKKAKLASDIPNITSDYMESINRDYLKHEAEASQNMSRDSGSMYNHKMWYENSEGVKYRPR